MNGTTTIAEFRDAVLDPPSAHTIDSRGFPLSIISAIAVL